ncbi:tripartite tricarboxylate transporter substrate binding protein [Roseomonas sp. E05]|uniref:Bug family tripartite tricarboxylate transporter substrate binding protein n=1 Tax=Roseomonas sp. E05 TaxID=3046310 RepID=UPI0024BA0033|nr:tripartite tricarboxylate transporter substrate binding protein [Roseomonas sp. E05]MDJ0390541.1 tripartite tricarboxylate transporter substrate binding protein [Roseomonas sp. E05]
MTNRIIPAPPSAPWLTRRRLLAAGAAVAAAPLARPALAEAGWRPSHPVRILVPFPPGGATDMLARLISQKIGNRLGQPLVIENRPGASGIIATQNLLNAPADGHSLLLATADTHTVMPAANKKLPYKVSEFVPVTGVAYVVFALVARPGLKVTDVPSLVRLAKAARPPLTYASYGVASASHAAGEMFKQAAGVDMVHVPYQGAGPGVTAITADQVDVMMVPVAVSYPQRERLRMLGVASGQRFAMVPDLPTLEEQGVPLVADAWIGLLAAPGTPKPVAESINAALGEALDTPDFAEALRTNGFSALGYGPERFASYLKEEDERWGKVVHEAGITVEI